MNVFYVNPTDPHTLRTPETLGTTYGRVYLSRDDAEADVVDPMNDDLDTTVEIVECTVAELPCDLYEAGVDATSVPCECGSHSDSGPCYASVPENGCVLVEYMPQHLRASHTAAGNSGVYPHNGSLRIRVHPDCAQEILLFDPDWSREVQP